MYSLESPHRGDSNTHTQYTIIVEIEKKIPKLSHLLPDLVSWLTLSGSNYQYLQQIPIVLKMFEPLKFDCMSPFCLIVIYLFRNVQNARHVVT